MCLLFQTFLFAACSDDDHPQHYQEMAAYHVESQHLTVATADSVGRFVSKVGTFVSRHPDAQQDPLYPEIKQNIQQNLLRLNITINDEWLGDIYVNF